MMFIVQLTYKVLIDEVDKYLQKHREFLEKYYTEGLLLVSGPMEPRTGGIIVATTNDKSYLESVLQQDPYYLAGIATYQLIQFTPVKYCDELKPLLKPKGNSC